MGERLRSDDALERIGACEDVDDPAAADVLVAALDGLDLDDRAFGAALCAALGRLGVATSAPALVRAFERALGDDVVPVAAVEALAKLPADAVVADLERLLRDPENRDYEHELRDALEAVAPGRVREDDGALRAALVDGDAVAFVRAVERIRDERRTALADDLLEAAERRPGLRMTVLGAAAAIGDPRALAKLYVVRASGTPSRRLEAAVLLWKAGREEELPGLLAALRANQGAGADAVPEDAHARRVGSQKEAIDAVVAWAERHPADAVGIADVLDAVRRERHGNPPPVLVHAQKAVERLTGTSRFSEYDAWRRSTGR